MCKFDNYLAAIDESTKILFEHAVKSLAKHDQITEKLKYENMVLWVRKMNNIRNLATEIINKQVIYNLEKGTTYGENFRRLCLNFICVIKMYNLSKHTNYGKNVQIGCFRFVVKQQHAVYLDSYTSKHLVKGALRTVISRKIVFIVLPYHYQIQQNAHLC